jgi:hypothetical protein
VALAVGFVFPALGVLRRADNAGLLVGFVERDIFGDDQRADSASPSPFTTASAAQAQAAE